MSQSVPILKTSPRRLVVRGVNWLGDAVMSTPALLRLRAAFPETHICLATPSKLAGLWTSHPAIDRVIPLAPAQGVWSVGRLLRAGQFDLAIVFPNSPRSALEVWLAGVPMRLGYAARWRRWWLTHPLPRRPGAVLMRKRSAPEVRRLRAVDSRAQAKEPNLAGGPALAHHVHHYLHLVAALGAQPEPLPPLVEVAESEVRDSARRLGFPYPAPGGRPLLGLNPGAEYGPAKRWPPERFVAAAREIHQATACQWLILGGPADVSLAASIATELGPSAGETLNFAGRTNLRDLCAVLKACRVLLTNDTGPMHLAAAVGTPVVVPFGSTSPELTGPGLPGDSRHRLLRAVVPCSPCFRRQCPIDFRCMNSIQVEQVVAGVLESLGLYR